MVVHLRRMKHQDLLLTPGEPVRGSTTVSFAAGGQDRGELPTTLRAAAPEGARIEGPMDTPWFTSDLTIDDADGNRVILTAPREAEMDRAKEWAQIAPASATTATGTTAWTSMIRASPPPTEAQMASLPS
ncbi:MAG: hypothetical protein FWJ93_10440 [Micromonosporaceae bacterium]